MRRCASSRATSRQSRRIAADDTITDAKIVPPTSQNLRVIEADLREFAGPRLGLPHDQLTWQCEQAVRSHDPCISCATRFLDLRVRDGTAGQPGPAAPPAG